MTLAILLCLMLVLGAQVLMRARMDQEISSLREVANWKARHLTKKALLLR